MHDSELRTYCNIYFGTCAHDVASYWLLLDNLVRTARLSGAFSNILGSDHDSRLPVKMLITDDSRFRTGLNRTTKRFA